MVPWEKKLHPPPSGLVLREVLLRPGPSWKSRITNTVTVDFPLSLKKREREKKKKAFLLFEVFFKRQFWKYKACREKRAKFSWQCQRYQHSWNGGLVASEIPAVRLWIFHWTFPVQTDVGSLETLNIYYCSLIHLFFFHMKLLVPSNPLTAS